MNESDKAFQAGNNAVDTAKTAAVAQEIARAADSAALLSHVEKKLEDYNRQNMDTITRSLSKVVSDALGSEPSKYVVVSRVPLLCQSVIEINKKMDSLTEMMKENRENSDKQHESFVTKESYEPVKKLIYGMVSLILITVCGAVLTLVIKQ